MPFILVTCAAWYYAHDQNYDLAYNGALIPTEGLNESQGLISGVHPAEETYKFPLLRRPLIQHEDNLTDEPLASAPPPLFYPTEFVDAKSNDHQEEAMIPVHRKNSLSKSDTALHFQQSPMEAVDL